MSEDGQILGRGKLFFAPYPKGETTGGTKGFLGNVSSVQLAQSNTKLDHYSSTHGLKIKNKSIILQSDQSVTFTTDTIHAGNIALWFGGNDTDALPSDAPSDIGVIKAVGRQDPVFGALTFEADNPEGDNNNYWWPYVSLVPNGNLELISDTWQVMTFQGEVLKRDEDTQRVYVYEMADHTSVAPDDAAADLTVAMVAVAGGGADVATGGTVTAPATVDLFAGFYVSYTLTGGTEGWIRLHDGSALYRPAIRVTGSSGIAGPFTVLLADTYTAKLFDNAATSGSALATSGNIVGS